MHSSGGCADVTLVHRHDVEHVLALLLREHVHRVGGIVIIAVQILWQKKIKFCTKLYLVSERATHCIVLQS